jgi:glycerophosphoryl diester phosphodiesterase
VASVFFEPTGPRVLAHRGLALDVPENTLPAFAAARDAGAEYLETDVRLTRDGVAVLAHDARVRPRSGDAAIDVASRTMTALAAADLGGGIGFTRLDDALDAFPALRFNIDVKVDTAVDAAVAAVRRTNASDRVLLASFSEPRRRRLARELPGAATSSGRTGVVRAWAAALAGGAAAMRAALAGAAALQVPERTGATRLVTPRLIAAAHAIGVEVHVWTVNEPAHVHRLFALGVDGVVTDRCDLAVPIAHCTS